MHEALEPSTGPLKINVNKVGHRKQTQGSK